MEFEDLGECLINLFSEDVLDDQGETADKYINRICLICQYSLAIGAVIIVPECRHWLHRSCFVKYKNNECPLDGLNISESYEEVKVDWNVDDDDDDDDVVVVVKDIATVGVRVVEDSVARGCSLCRVLYVPGVFIITCMDCGETFCTSCVIAACPLCDARAFATHYASDDVQGPVPVQGPVDDDLFEYPIGGVQGPVDDDPFEYPIGGAQTFEQALEATRLVPSHLFVIGDDTDSDSEVVQPFGDYALELRGGAAVDEADRV